MKLSKEKMYEILDSDDVVENNVVDNSRWSIHHELIFRYEDRVYRSFYSVGATEMQDESPWDGEDPVECAEMVSVEKTVVVWSPATESAHQEQEYEHPSFVRAKALPEPLRTHFPKNQEEALAFKPHNQVRALSRRVLVVAHTRVECAWCAYCDAVPGINHDREIQPVLDHGSKLLEGVARALFPRFDDVPYAP